MPTVRRTAPTPRPADSDDRVLLQSKALGDRTRYAILRYIVEARASVGVAELTDHFGLNHNAIRQHLAKLRDAKLVIEDVAPATGPGRPALRYRPTPGAEHRWDGPTPYEALTRMLVELVRGEGDPREVGRRQGVRLVDEYQPDGDTLTAMEEITRRLGFEPHQETTTEGADIVLARCPFAASAIDAPEIICEIHLGIAEGIATAIEGSDAGVDGLTIEPATTAGCRIHLAQVRAQAS